MKSIMDILNEFGGSLVQALGYDELVLAYGPTFETWYTQNVAEAQ